MLFQGAYLHKNVAGAMVLILGTSYGNALYTKFHEYILDGIKIIERTRILLEKIKGT